MTALLPDDEPTAVHPGQDRRRLGDVLVDAKVITEAELTAALDAQRTVIGSRRRLGHVLVDLGVVTERQITEALADQLRLEVVDLNRVVISPESVRLLPRGVGRRLGMLILSR